MARGRISKARIEERRIVRGFATQAALARSVPMPQQTLNSILRSEPETSPWLIPLAQTLRTTPAYLSCLTDDPMAEAPPEPELAADERAIVADLRSIDEADRRAFAHIVRALARPADTNWPREQPEKRALAVMFRVMLEALPPELPWDDQADQLAEWLPVGLAQLVDILPEGDPAAALAPVLAGQGRETR